MAIHSVDLNITTNVHTINDGEFQGRARKSKANGNEWGYYVQDFTWEEIQKLRVKQRVVDSGARTTYYDGLFGVPSFAQIVSLLYDWNTRELPLIGRPSAVGGVAGLYVELKRAQFFQEDANVSIADLFLNELASHPKASELLFDHVDLCEGLKYNEYRVPPLVLQSFEGETLLYLRRKFKERWMDFVEEDALLSEGRVNETSLLEDDEVDHPWIPPMVLLVDSTYCHSTDFWYEIAKYQVRGLGPSKDCLLPSTVDSNLDNSGNIERAKRMAREWVAKAHSERLAVHPWTVRLEMESQGQTGGVPGLFASAEEEIRYYYCDLKVDGIFTENIAIAQIVGEGGCDDYEVKSSGRGGPVCVEKERSLWFFGMSFLALGIFVGAVSTCFVSAGIKRGCCEGAISGRQEPRSLPLPEVDTSLDLEEEEEGHSVL